MAYLAPSLATLRSEINAAHSGRDKSSDGWVGDTAHAARKSDHNPVPPPNGVVRATDTDKDGPDMGRLLQIACNDPRVEYVIWEGHIYTRANGFRKAKYTGSNGHFGHMHISIRHGAQFENDTRPWGYAGGAPSGGGGGKLTVEQVATEVIAGRWGSGADRIKRLSDAGYNYEAVRAEVNRRLGGGAPVPSVPARKSVAEIAGEVIAGRWGSGEDRKNRLRGAGYNPDEVQREINARLQGGGGGAPVPAKPNVEQIAREVIAGKWGNGPARAANLQRAGYSPQGVQEVVNRILGGRPAITSTSVTELARQVIRGQWGSGAERTRRLTSAGYNAAAVQAEVNRLL